jgi:hypothetical protein
VSKRVLLAWIAFLAVAALFATGVVKPTILFPEYTAAPPAKASTLEPTPPPMPQELGNGVVYFNATGEKYTKALVEFYGREENANIHCDLQGFTQTRAVVYNSQSSHTVTTGFILHCTDTASHAQELTVP